MESGFSRREQGFCGRHEIASRSECLDFDGDVEETGDWEQVGEHDLADDHRLVADDSVVPLIGYRRSHTNRIFGKMLPVGSDGGGSADSTVSLACKCAILIVDDLPLDALHSQIVAKDVGELEIVSEDILSHCVEQQQVAAVCACT